MLIKNYLILAFRNIIKRKLYSIINIVGLAVGLAVVILISLFLSDELSYDKFHKDANNIYRIAWMSGDPQTRTPHPMAQAMVRDFPEIEKAVSLTPLWGPGLTVRTFSIKVAGKPTWHEEKSILGVDSTFFDVFSFNLIKGNKATILRNVGGVLISQRMAEKYFQDEDPIGRQLALDTEEQLLMVEGVFENVPDNSHFHFDFLISYVTLKAFEREESEFYKWADFGHFNYIQLSDKSDPTILESKLMNWAGGYLDWNEQDIKELKAANNHFGLQPIKDIHLKSSLRWELESNGNIEYIYIMSAAAIFILLIAIFNFMNLSIAKSMERASEVGIRKSFGAERTQLYFQFLGESILLSIFALIVAGVLVEAILPSFNFYTSKNLVLSISDPVIFTILLGGTVLVGILAGVFPAAYLSGMKPALILKGKFSNSAKGQMLRKVLVILQFAISMFLIAGSWSIISQLNFLKNKDLGFDKEEIIVLPLNSQELRDRFEIVQAELKKIESIKNVSAASNIPGKQFNQNPVFLKSNPDNRVYMSECFVEYEFFSTLGIKLTKGRYFDKNRPADVRNTFIINESAAIALSLEQPVGEEIILEADGRLIEGEIIGVVKDFNYISLHQPIRPMAMLLVPAYNHLLIKLDTRNFEQTIEALESTMVSLDNRFVFDYEFLDDTLSAQYQNEESMSVVFGSFAVLAIIIACLGLGGLAAINFSFRKKEVGIKKVLGASARTLVFNLLKEYTVIVLISIVISAPFYWLIISNWLQNFTYRIPLNPLAFLSAGLLLLVVSWLTLSYLTFVTIKANPIKALKEE
jgi:putative ABC transport system permease protein